MATDDAPAAADLAVTLHDDALSWLDLMLIGAVPARYSLPSPDGPNSDRPSPGAEAAQPKSAPARLRVPVETATAVRS
ncbi:MAG TPA: hypothetical protein VMT27_04600, partial [Actinomycetes bacterium]|nr:hypothetical protein [Actinomycetes bacterium]